MLRNFKTTSMQQRSAILAALLILGYRINPNVDESQAIITTLLNGEANHPFDSNPVIRVSTDHGLITFLGTDRRSSCSLEEFLAPFKREGAITLQEIGVDIDSNEGISATVRRGENDVMVGCKKFPISKVREVLAAYEKLNGTPVVAESEEQQQG